MGWDEGRTGGGDGGKDPALSVLDGLTLRLGELSKYRHCAGPQRRCRAVLVPTRPARYHQTVIFTSCHLHHHHQHLIASATDLWRQKKQKIDVSFDYFSCTV